MNQQLMQIVDRIPVNQKAPATYPMKRFLLQKMTNIFNNRAIIERAARDKRKQEILDAYKKSVGFDKKLKAVKEAKAKLEKAEKDLMEIGLNEDGYLLEVSENPVAYDGGMEETVRWNNYWVRVAKGTMAKVKQVKELLKAVEGAVDVYTQFDRLETRMVMASTVGEVMALINAAVGEEVFRVETKNLLEDKQPNGKETKK